MREIVRIQAFPAAALGGGEWVAKGETWLNLWVCGFGKKVTGTGFASYGRSQYKQTAPAGHGVGSDPSGGDPMKKAIGRKERAAQ